MNINFVLEESLQLKGRYMIRVDWGKTEVPYIEGSWQLLPARVLGIPYDKYCELCKDYFNATLVNKNSIYIFPVFNSKNEAMPLIDELNQRVKVVNFKEGE